MLRRKSTDDGHLTTRTCIHESKTKHITINIVL